MKLTLNKRDYNHFSNILSNQVIDNVITDDQYKSIMKNIDIKPSLNFVKVISLFGSILVGLGILLLIASNWYRFIPNIKLIILIVGYLSFTLLGYKYKDNSKIISKSLTYISAFIYIAGVILIDDMYMLGLEPYIYMIFIMAGLIPITFANNDLIILIGTSFANLALGSTLVEGGESTFILFQFVPAITTYLLYRYNNNHVKSDIVVGLLIGGLMISIATIMNYFEIDGLYIAFVIFSLAIYIYLRAKTLFVSIAAGLIMVGASLSISIKDIWDVFKFSNPEVFSTTFSIFASLFYIYLIKEGRYMGVVGLTVMILRYYFDSLYDYLPRSLFFIIGGFVLVAMAVFLDRMRKEDKDEKEFIA
jgi:uncharacterized membrane protein